ncbi:MAG TPA: PAS domain-containing protein [Vicinamibacterales bacterium]|nr:PAS domain-containing protein [Vicinamibacterales bacterium]
MSFDRHVLAVIETLHDVLDRSPACVLLLDEHRRIVFANQQAEHLDQRNDGISLSGGAISLIRKQDSARLCGLITRALATGASGGTAMRAFRPSGKRPYGIFVAPLSRRPPSSSLRPAVCVVITNTDALRDLPIDSLRGVFDLTEAEGRLAALLAAGEDLKTAAKELSITYGTARARLAEIFLKTETRRQGELVNLLLTTLAI